jgi:hypothetical protein
VGEVVGEMAGRRWWESVVVEVAEVVGGLQDCGGGGEGGGGSWWGRWNGRWEGGKMVGTG